MSEEKIIVLANVNTNASLFYEGIGMSKEEFIKRSNQICTQHVTIIAIAEELELSKDEIVQTVKEMVLKNRTILEAMVSLWIQRDKTQITLRECIGTIILLQTTAIAFKERLLLYLTLAIDIRLSRIQTCLRKLSSRPSFFILSPIGRFFGRMRI